MTTYQQQAEDFLEKARTTMRIVKISRVQGFPFDKKDKHPHIKYQVILTNLNTGKSYDFPFYDSHANYRDDKRPTSYDVLSAVEKYEVDEDIWEFAREFGYETETKENWEMLQKVHRNCLDQYNALLDLFGEDLMKELQEIV